MFAYMIRAHVGRSSRFGHAAASPFNITQRVGVVVLHQTERRAPSQQRVYAQMIYCYVAGHCCDGNLFSVRVHTNTADDQTDTRVMPKEAVRRGWVGSG